MNSLGISALGLAHALIGLAALLLSVAVLLRRKGDRMHKRLGWVVTPLMFIALATAVWFGLARGSFHAFNVYAAFALAALIGAVLASRFRARVPDWRFWHAGLMGFTVLSAVVATSGLFTAGAVGAGSGPQFYRAFNLVIVVLTLAALWLIAPHLRKLVRPETARRSLALYQGAVGLVTIGVVIGQAY